MPPRKRKAPAAKAKPGGKKVKKEEPAPPTDLKTALQEASKKEVKKKAKPDQYFPHISMAEVYDDYDCMLNLANIGKNNNKYYVIQILKATGAREQYWTWNRWGRVGEKGKFQCHGPFGSKDPAIKSFRQKFNDKTKNNWDDRASFSPVKGKYTMIEMSHEDDDEDEESMKIDLPGGVSKKVKPSTLDRETQNLLSLIFDNDMFKSQMAKFDIDVKKMPLGKLSKAQIAKGFDCLEELEAVINKTKKGNMTELSSQFYTLIPHDFKRMRPPPIQDLELLQKKYDMLAVLGDIEIAQTLQKQKMRTLSDTKAATLPHPLDVNYDLLKCDLKYIKPSSDTFKIIDTYCDRTCGSWRRAKVLQAWEVNRHGEDLRFVVHDKIDNRRLLWHGTNVAVVAAILKTGLRIMPHSGGRVGRGIYFASENGKSAGYVGTTLHEKKQVGIMFLNEVALGNEHTVLTNQCGLTSAPKGADCVIARGMTEPDPKQDKKIKIDGKEVHVPQGSPKKTKYTSSHFSESEYLVYKESQCRIRYLCLCQFG